MSGRKTPVLLRRGPLSGRINALTRYTEKGGTIRVADGGKHDVSGDFAVLACQTLIDEGYGYDDAPDIAAILDGVADGHELKDGERKQVRAFRERLVVLMEDANEHTASGEGRSDG